MELGLQWDLEDDSGIKHMCGELSRCNPEMITYLWVATVGIFGQSQT